MHRHLSFIVLLCGMFGWVWASGQEPLRVPESATQEDLEQVVVPLSEPVRRRIEEALRQQAAQRGAPIQSSGDPILDDVLEVIRRQGSLLEGSSLDPQLDRNADDLPERPRGRVNTVVPVPHLQVPPTPGPAIQHPDARFHVAETLLRAARELASLSHRDPAHNELIAAMREQATMLLLDEYSQDTNRFE